jgi:hypothetical protein
MSASDNNKPIKPEEQYDITDENDENKHRPHKFTVPASFIDPGVKAFDRQFVNLTTSDSLMYGGPNTGPQKIMDNIPGEDCQTKSHKEPFSYVRGSRCNEANKFSNRMIYNRPKVEDQITLCEGFQPSENTDKILDTILISILLILTMFVAYKIIYCKPKHKHNKNKTEEYDDDDD